MKLFLPLFIIACIFCGQPVSAQESPDIESLMQEASEAEELFDRAALEYEEGNLRKAEKLYRKALRKISASGMTAEMYSNLHGDFRSMFRNIDRMLHPEDTREPVIQPDPGLKKKKEPGEHPAAFSIQVDPSKELVQKYLRFYTSGKGRNRMEQALERSGRYREMILAMLRENNLPDELVYLPIVESLYKINAYSRAGAAGLWQLMTGTGRNLGLKVNYWIDERRDPEKSTRAALKYLNELYTGFDDWHLALAAYNRGHNGLLRDMKFSKSASINELEKRRVLPKETEDFVPKFMACTMIGSNPADYGFDIRYEPPLECDYVVINNVIDLEVAAKCAGTSASEIRKLNPSLNMWCTPVNYRDFKLRLPEGTRDTFLSNLSGVKELNPSRGYVKYKVRKGDFLLKIARRFNTSVHRIKADNNIRNANRIRQGQILIIRPGRKYFGK